MENKLGSMFAINSIQLKGAMCQIPGKKHPEGAQEFFAHCVMHTIYWTVLECLDLHVNPEKK